MIVSVFSCFRYFLLDRALELNAVVTSRTFCCSHLPPNLSIFHVLSGGWTIVGPLSSIDRRWPATPSRSPQNFNDSSSDSDSSRSLAAPVNSVRLQLLFRLRLHSPLHLYSRTKQICTIPHCGDDNVSLLLSGSAWRCRQFWCSSVSALTRLTVTCTSPTGRTTRQRRGRATSAAPPAGRLSSWSSSRTGPTIGRSLGKGVALSPTHCLPWKLLLKEH